MCVKPAEPRPVRCWWQKVMRAQRSCQVGWVMVPALGVGREWVHPGTMCVLGGGHISDQASVPARRYPVRGVQAQGSLPSGCANVRPIEPPAWKRS